MKPALLIVCGFLVLSQSAFALDFYVAPDGDDANPGSKAKPFKSLPAARDAVRKINRETTGEIVVHLRGGRYPITTPIKFGPQDSGLNGNRVNYRAAEGETAILTGGVPISGWTLHDEAKRIYSAKAPKSPFRQIYLDGERGIRSRTPNRVEKETFGPYWKFAGVNLETKVCQLEPSQVKALEAVRRKEEVEMVLLSHWYHQRLRLGELKTTADGGSFRPVNPTDKFTKKEGFYRGSFFFFENALAFVDAPGEWYHDHREGRLYLCVAKDKDPESLQVTVPVLERLVSLEGTADDPVENITLEGLTFECSNWTFPSENGINATQFAAVIGGDRQAINAGSYPPGLICARHARGLAFRGNRIRQAGGTGIRFLLDVDDSDIEGCSIDMIAGNGIEIDDGRRNPPANEQSQGVAIWNNEITRCGQDITNGGGIMAHNVRELVVEHNHIHHMPYSGIQIGNQPGGMVALGCVNNRVRYNHIHHCVQLHDDGGGIYTLGGIQEGTVISENHLHDIERGKWAGSYGISMIYLDNYTSKILVRNNVVRGGKAEQRNRAQGNFFENNLQRNVEVEANAGIRPGYRPTPITAND